VSGHPVTVEEQSMTFLPLRTAAAVIGLASALSLTSAPGVAQDAGLEYVALGDSYASGLGTGEYYEGSGTCWRSPHAYPVAAAVGVGAALRFRACAGAQVADVVDRLRPLDRATDYVSVQVGGNDAGFADVLLECAKPRLTQDCDAVVREARAFIRERLPRRLARLYRRIERRSPSARVFVVGYPRLFHDEDCNAGTWFSRSDRRLLNGTADILNRRTAGQARSAGFAFVNPTRAFLGHAVCDSPEWVNGLSSPATESYHPNRSGQDAYARLVTRRLR
jgi:lysophospholipase L1-like esterase